MNKIRNRKNNKGFSLVELIIVIAIMAILAGILIPQFVKYISSSKVSGDIQQAENIYNAVAAKYADDQGVEKDGLSYDGNKHEVTDAVAEALEMGKAAPTCKVDSRYLFMYSCDDKGAVAVYLAPASEKDKAYDATKDTKISPSIDGKDASKWTK